MDPESHGELSSDHVLLPTEITSVTAQAAEPRVSECGLGSEGEEEQRRGEGVFPTFFSSVSSIMWSGHLALLPDLPRQDMGILSSLTPYIAYRSGSFAPGCYGP